MTIAVVDVCSGNLRSVERALARAGGGVVVTRDPDVVRRADKIVVPGQGAFGVFMRGLAERGLGEALRLRGLEQAERARDLEAGLAVDEVDRVDHLVEQAFTRSAHRDDDAGERDVGDQPIVAAALAEALGLVEIVVALRAGVARREREQVRDRPCTRLRHPRDQRVGSRRIERLV